MGSPFTVTSKACLTVTIRVHASRSSSKAQLAMQRSSVAWGTGEDREETRRIKERIKEKKQRCSLLIRRCHNTGSTGAAQASCVTLLECCVRVSVIPTVMQSNEDASILSPERLLGIRRQEERIQQTLERWRSYLHREIARRMVRGLCPPERFQRVDRNSRFGET